MPTMLPTASVPEISVPIRFPSTWSGLLLPRDRGEIHTDIVARYEISCVRISAAHDVTRGADDRDASVLKVRKRIGRISAMTRRCPKDPCRSGFPGFASH